MAADEQRPSPASAFSTDSRKCYSYAFRLSSTFPSFARSARQESALDSEHRTERVAAIDDHS